VFWRRRALGVLIVLCLAGGVVAGASVGRAPHHHGVSGRSPVVRGAAALRSGQGRRARGSAGAGADAAVQRLTLTTPVVTGGVPRHRVIALTFDDGPSPYTPQILRSLTRLHAPATFFVVGQQLRYFSDGLRQEVRDHFEIGDHTENHVWLLRLKPAAQYTQIQSVASWMERLGAPAPTLFRPPYGAYDGGTIAVLRKLRMLEVLWSIDPGDWRRPGSRAIAKSVLSAARPGGIVELHDGGGNRSQTLAALPAIVKGLRHRHYELVTVSRLLALDPPPRQRQLPHLSAAA
jgi:peptidoglycan/xylan/chitin deacetylase (PgdA/CDA1 family)